MSITATASPLTTCQEKALDMLKREGNIFLTGAAGTGKSFLLQRYLQNKSTTDFPIVASTGAAAVLVGGRTFHSFFGLGILEGGKEATVLRAIKNRRVVQRLQRAYCVVIDEISMLSGETLHVAETIAKRARASNQPWGGLRIIAVGDFAQLPPVTPGNTHKDWAFCHPVWEETTFQPALLSTVMRTQDQEFLQVLNAVREGIVNQDVQNFLDARTLDQDFAVEGTRLYPHRMQADQYNAQKLASLPEELHQFDTEYTGADIYMNTAKKAMPIPSTLLLKKGALIMMRKNDVSGDLQWGNGSLGHIRRIFPDSLHITLLSGHQMEVGKEKFSYTDGDGKEVVAAWNFPVTLAWATTIHKAQGASLDSMTVDLQQLWEPGQAYVALSRVRSGAGLRVERWSPSSIRSEPLVTSLYNSFVQQTEQYTPRPYFETPKSAKNPTATKSTLSKNQRIQTTKALLQEGEGLETIAKRCEVTVATIVRYLSQFIKNGEQLPLEHLEAAIPEAGAIRVAYAKHGLDHMKPIYDELGGNASYEDIRLIRLLINAQQKR